MQHTDTLHTDTHTREIVQERLLNAPRELVFDVWTRPEHIAKWWGPTGFTTTIHEMEVKEGCIWRSTMHGPDGTNYPNLIKYKEVVRPERLVYDHGTGIEGDPHRFEVTVTFEDVDGKTKLTMRCVFPTASERDAVAGYAVEGGRQTINKLEDHLAAIQDHSTGLTHLMTRTLDAPISLVWRAWTEARHLATWWGPKGFDTQVAELELRPGGLFHYSFAAPGGPVEWGRFIFHEVSEPNRLVFVVSFSDENAGVTRAPFSADWPLEILNVVEMKEENGKTTLNLWIKALNANEKEQDMFRSMTGSMVEGYGGTFDKLGILLKTIA
ncbi:hypothetical protein GCM10023093_28340 [Nemorincola caseinilytica]|uniref:Activator of Hsp90 ATPase homologue 1/2-like C-terminal domain-containing protein n=1 Tax=Nemorincola caseinilytica TaxID=2054315 RepID=A0ABP8NLD7_9BACT